MDLGLSGAGVLVTGASRGLGRAIALAFAAEGANVSICGRSPDALDATRAELLTLGVEAHGFVTDLTDTGACERLVDQAAEMMGRLDVVVNNAAPDVLSRAANPTADRTAPMLERIVGKALVAVRCSTTAVPHLVRSGGGAIVIIAGTASRQPFTPAELGTAVTTAASGFGNAAVVNFAKHLADEVATHRIRVNVVHPHAMKTDRYHERVAEAAQRDGVPPETAERRLASYVPLGRVPEVTDVAPLVVFLGSPQSTMTTGQSIAVDGGAVRSVFY